MISPAKVAANQQNARKSTGPRTVPGKARASLNAVKHGLFSRMPVIEGEDVAEFQNFTAEWLSELRPAGPLEGFLAERIIGIAWRLRRVGQLEADLFKPGESQDPSQLSRLNRYESTLERSFYRNLKELRELQAERAGAEQEETTDSADYAEQQNEPTVPQVQPHVLVNQPEEQHVLR